MPRLSIAITLTALLGLFGCITPSIDSFLVGTYIASDSETLTIQSDHLVYHSHLVDGREQRVLIGYATATSSNPPGSLSIIGPDTSAYLGTSIKLSDDSCTVTVHWHTMRETKFTPKQTCFVRK